MSEMIDHQRRPISVEEYHRIRAAGIIGADERLELLGGELILKGGMSPPLAAAVTRLSEFLVPRLLGSALVRVQLPCRLDDKSELEPNVAVVRAEARFYADRHPVPGDVLLVIELSEAYGLTFAKRAAAYAGAGIPELWVADLTERQVYVMRDPKGDAYAQTRTFKAGERSEAAAFPGLLFAMDDLLG